MDESHSINTPRIAVTLLAVLVAIAGCTGRHHHGDWHGHVAEECYGPHNDVVHEAHCGTSE